MFSERKSGVLLHPTSLPSPYGVGDLGAAAYDFIDRLASAGQSLWQVLPLCPADYSGSPYQSCSAFAGFPLLISLELLAEDGLLTEADLSAAVQPPRARVDYTMAAAAKLPLLDKAFQAFRTQGVPADFAAFRKENAFWLEDYALFMALKTHFWEERQNETGESFAAFAAEFEDTEIPEETLRGYYESACWNSFPQALRRRNAGSLKKWQTTLSGAIEKEIFLQYEFQKQWRALKAYANEKHISIIGDAPIFVAFDSADVWANQKLFQLDSKGFPVAVAGVPPDYFSETGQLWGNPLYDWKQHEKTGFAWWTSRIQKNLADVDILRIDHFRGFESYWAVPFGAEDARGGEWEKAPGLRFFRALQEKLGTLPLIAEDLGFITEEVRALREAAGFPGMRILQFSFGSDANNPYLPHCYDRNTVVYTGTHDNDTTLGWYESASEREKDHFRRYMNVSGKDAAWDMIRLAFSSPAQLAVVPLQDILGLGTEHRMNIPGTTGGNWGFAFCSEQWTEGCTNGLLYLSRLFGRNGEQIAALDAPPEEEKQLENAENN